MGPQASAAETPLGGDDERLLIEAAKADRRRFGELYERNFDRVYAYVARRAGGREAAEDLTADYAYVDDVDAAYDRALTAGATSIEAPALQPYGERRAAVLDAFDNRWYLAAAGS